MAKLFASQASWRAANACVTAFGGHAFAREFDVERKLREAKLLEIAPVSDNLILAYIGQRTFEHAKVVLTAGQNALLRLVLDRAGGSLPRGGDACCQRAAAAAGSKRQPLPSVFSNEGAFAPEPFRQSPRNVAQSHTGRLKVPVGAPSRNSSPRHPSSSSACAYRSGDHWQR